MKALTEVTRKVSTINSSNRPTVLNNNWNKFTLIKYTIVTVKSTIKWCSDLPRIDSFVVWKTRANQSTHAISQFCVAIAQFSHFSTQKTAPFPFYDWVRLRQPIVMNAIWTRFFNASSIVYSNNCNSTVNSRKHAYIIKIQAVITLWLITLTRGPLAYLVFSRACKIKYATKTSSLNSWATVKLIFSNYIRESLSLFL